jgi:hypothetical protein
MDKTLEPSCLRNMDLTTSSGPANLIWVQGTHWRPYRTKVWAHLVEILRNAIKKLSE